MQKTIIVLIIAIVTLGNCLKEPPTPVWPDSFLEAFDEEFILANNTFIVNGILYYDGANNRSRLDRTNGQYDKFCSSLAPNLTTSCTTLVVNEKRYIIFPEKALCCFCCDAAHGCGILKQDWLAGAEYLGQQKIHQQVFDKWNKQGVVGYNYYYCTTDDNQYPRRINENGVNIFDFNIYSFRRQPLDKGLFTVPTYCKNSCPSTSACGSLQSKPIKNLLIQQQ